RSAADPGWQLSFAAVLGIALGARRVATALRERRVPPAAAEATAMTVAATVATAPLIALHFGRASLVGLPANVLAAPAVAPAMWLGAIAGAIGQLSPALAAPVAACVAFALPRGAGAPPPPALRISFLDVGQGDATLIQAGGRAVLVDAGPPGDHIASLVRGEGARRLDLLVVTHAQADHEGGAAEVLSQLPVTAVLDGRDGVASADGARFEAAARAHPVRLLRPSPGQILRAGP